MSGPSIVWERAPAARPRGAECRVYERHACELQTTCQPIAARSDRDIVWPATIRDVSEGGVGVIMGRRFERGAGLAIEIPAAEGRPAETLLARVVHATALPGKRWLLGCAFVSRLSDDEVRLVVALAAALRAPAPGAKNAARPPVASPAPPGQPVLDQAQKAGDSLLLTDLWFEGSAQDGQAVRLPVRRLFLTGSWPLTVGTILRLWVGDKNRHPAGTRVKVVECQLQNGRWSVTYRPLEPIAAETLRSLGFAG